jgi:perosamine synthetase
MERYGFLDRFVKYHDPGKIDMPNDYLQAMTGIEARVGTVQCQSYAEIIRHRRNLARVYLDGLNRTTSLELPIWNPGATYSHFVIRTTKAKQLSQDLLKNGIQLGNLIDYYIPEMPAYRGFKTYCAGNAKQWPNQVINLPVHMGVKLQDAEKIIELIRLSSSTDF